jgi:hypothetical protein
MRGPASRTVPAIVGVAALVLLLVIAGSGFLSQLDLGAAAGPGSAGSFAIVAPASAAPAAKPPAGKDGGGGGNGSGHGPKDCRGHGHGNDCAGEEK